MGLTNLFKLEKLKIKAYSSRARSLGDLIGTFEAMFNPETFNQKYEIIYGRAQGFNSTGKEVNYARSKPSDMRLELIVDGTGVDEMDILQLKPSKSVADRIKEFVTLTYRMNGDIHEPNFLVVEWGDFIFSCRLGSVDITYTSFDRSGKPLRATLVVQLVADHEVKKRMAKENKSSPDLTHIRTVKSGDTLPQLTSQIYGTSVYYLRVAQFNRLDDFRNLTPGQEIIFPPLER